MTLRKLVNDVAAWWVDGMDHGDAYAVAGRTLALLAAIQLVGWTLLGGIVLLAFLLYRHLA